MIRPVSLILAIILILACSGCYWDHGRGGYGEQDREGYGERDRGGSGDQDRGGHDGYRHDDRRDPDDHR